MAGYTCARTHFTVPRTVMDMEYKECFIHISFCGVLLLFHKPLIDCCIVSTCTQEENTMDPPQSVQRGVTDLVEAALTPRNLCMMDPTWHPWF
jgi:hypothetical protein